MLERDYMNTYNLSRESAMRLYRKAENDRLAKLIHGPQGLNLKLAYGFFGALNFLLAAFLLMR